MLKILENKKGVVEWVVLILIILIFLIAIFTPFWGGAYRECRSNEDCGSNGYCGSDYQCHALQIIEKRVVERQYGEPALIIAAAIIISIIILKLDLSRFI